MLKEILTEHQVQKSQLVRCWQNTNEWVSFGQGILMQWLDMGQIKTICGNILKCVLGLDREVYSVFSHVSIAIWGQKHKEATNRFGEDPFSPKDASLGLSDGGAMVDPGGEEPWWSDGSTTRRRTDSRAPVALTAAATTCSTIRHQIKHCLSTPSCQIW